MTIILFISRVLHGNISKHRKQSELNDGIDQPKNHNSSEVIIKSASSHVIARGKDQWRQAEEKEELFIELQKLSNLFLTT